MKNQGFMTGEEKWRCKAWIEKYLHQSYTKRADSYTLKHQFERMTGIYCSDHEFQSVMREVGYEPVKETESLFLVKVDNAVIERVYGR